MMTKKESTKFSNPGAVLVSCAGTWPLNCNIFSPLLFFSGAWIRQIKYIVMMTKEGFSKIVNFMTQGQGLKLCIILMTCINIQHIDSYCLKGL